MIRKILTRLFYIFVIAFSSEVFAREESSDGIALLDVLKSTLSLHPKIYSFEAKVEQADGKRLSATGNFDWKLEYDHQSRTGGFYDGWFGDQRLSRQLGWSNAKLSAGYRLSDGGFPVYEEYHRTQDEGEPNLKFSMSLLRYRETDPLRQEILQTELGFDVVEQNQRELLNHLLREAGFNYLNWREAYLEAEIQKGLLQLAEQRNDAIRARVANGDLAKFVETEFQTTLLARSAALQAMLQKLRAAELKLSLYIRDPEGLPVNLNEKQNPIDDDAFDNLLNENLNQVMASMQNHPRLRALRLRKQQITEQRRLAASEMLPSLDMNLWLARDLGTGSETLEGTESYVGVNFSLPLERRKAKGKLRVADAELRALKFDQQAAQETMRNFIATALLEIDNLQTLLKLQKEQAALEARLTGLELKRFNAGDSDLFILNAREISRAQADLRVVKTETEIMRKRVNLLASSAQLSDLVREQTTPFLTKKLEPR